MAILAPVIGDFESGVVAQLTGSLSVNGSGPTTTEQDLWVAYTLPNSNRNQGPIIGTTYRMTVGGTNSGQATSGTVTIRLRLGGTLFYTLVLPSWGAGGGPVTYWLDSLLTIRTIGAGGTFTGFGVVRAEWSTGTVLSNGVIAGAVNTTTGAQLKLTCQFATGVAANLMTADVGMVERLRA